MISEYNKYICSIRIKICIIRIVCSINYYTTKTISNKKIRETDGLPLNCSLEL